MKRFLVLAFAAQVFAAQPAHAVADPHGGAGEARCLSCHSRVIQAEDARAGRFYFLRESIEGVCLICHVKEECCRIGQRHEGEPLWIGVSHPSDIPADEVKPTSRPKSLPLQDGKITCNTCHVHDRRKPVDYKLLRIVVVKDTGVDWTGLCADCHADY